MKFKTHKISKKFSISIGKMLGIIFLLILFFSVFLFIKFNQKITPKLLNVAVASVNKLNESILTNYKVKNLYKDVDLNDAISIVKNGKGEIITVDFKLEQVYEALSLITTYLQENLEDVNVRNQVLNHYNEDLSSGLDSIILSIPIGVASDKIYLANLGPRIPVKVSYMGYIASSVRIKLEDYGINNALISIFIDCSISNEFIAPNVKEKIGHEYSILIASKIIQGIVPNYYGGVMETKSSILNVPIN